MKLDNNGLIVLQNASDSDICFGNIPGQILGDGTGGSLVASSTYGEISVKLQFYSIRILLVWFCLKIAFTYVPHTPFIFKFGYRFGSN